MNSKAHQNNLNDEFDHNFIDRLLNGDHLKSRQPQEIAAVRVLRTMFHKTRPSEQQTIAVPIWVIEGLLQAIDQKRIVN
jgi:hypothetical protein